MEGHSLCAGDLLLNFRQYDKLIVSALCSAQLYGKKCPISTKNVKYIAFEISLSLIGAFFRVRNPAHLRTNHRCLHYQEFTLKNSTFGKDLVMLGMSSSLTM